MADPAYKPGDNPGAQKPGNIIQFPASGRGVASAGSGGQRTQTPNNIINLEDYQNNIGENTGNGAGGGSLLDPVLTLAGIPPMPKNPKDRDRNEPNIPDEKEQGSNFFSRFWLDARSVRAEAERLKNFSGLRLMAELEKLNTSKGGPYANAVIEELNSNKYRNSPDKLLAKGIGYVIGKPLNLAGRGVIKASKFVLNPIKKGSAGLAKKLHSRMLNSDKNTLGFGRVYRFSKKKKEQASSIAGFLANAAGAKVKQLVSGAYQAYKGTTVARRVVNPVSRVVSTGASSTARAAGVAGRTISAIGGSVNIGLNGASGAARGALLGGAAALATGGAALPALALIGTGAAVGAGTNYVLRRASMSSLQLERAFDNNIRTQYRLNSTVAQSWEKISSNISDKLYPTNFERNQLMARKLVIKHRNLLKDPKLKQKLLDLPAEILENNARFKRIMTDAFRVNTKSTGWYKQSTDRIRQFAAGNHTPGPRSTMSDIKAVEARALKGNYTSRRVAIARGLNKMMLFGAVGSFLAPVAGGAALLGLIGGAAAGAAYQASSTTVLNRVMQRVYATPVGRLMRAVPLANALQLVDSGIYQNVLARRVISQGAIERVAKFRGIDPNDPRLNQLKLSEAEQFFYNITTPLGLAMNVVNMWGHLSLTSSVQRWAMQKYGFRNLQGSARYRNLIRMGFGKPSGGNLGMRIIGGTLRAPFRIARAFYGGVTGAGTGLGNFNIRAMFRGGNLLRFVNPAAAAGGVIGGVLGAAGGALVATALGLPVGPIALSLGALGSIAGSAIGAFVGSFIGPIGTIIGSFVGGAVGSFVGTLGGAFLDKMVGNILPNIPNPLIMVTGIWNFFKLLGSPLRDLGDYADIGVLLFSLITFIVAVDGMTGGSRSIGSGDLSAEYASYISEEPLLVVADELELTNDGYSLVFNPEIEGNFYVSGISGINENIDGTIEVNLGNYTIQINGADSFVLSASGNSISGTGRQINAIATDTQLTTAIDFCQITKLQECTQQS